MKNFVIMLKNGTEIDIVAASKTQACHLAVERGLLKKDDFYDVICIVEKSDS